MSVIRSARRALLLTEFSLGLRTFVFNKLCQPNVNPTMNKNLTLLTVILLALGTVAEAQNFRGMDKSPLDNAYFPDHFAHDRKPGDEAVIRVTYSRPQANGREVLGNLVPYGEVWRTGANEAPEVKLYKDVTIDGQKLSAGTYSLFTIPEKDSWTIIFNKDLNYWGAYSYDQKQDVLRVSAPAKPLEQPLEAFSIQFEEGEGDTAIMHLGWGKGMASLTINL